MNYYKSWNEWKNHRVRVEFKEINNGNEYQMLIFFDNDKEPIYKTNKGTFEFKEMSYYKLKLNKWYLPQCYKTTYKNLDWKDKNKFLKYIAFTNKFRICNKIQDAVANEIVKLSERVSEKEGFVKI